MDRAGNQSSTVVSSYAKTGLRIWVTDSEYSVASNPGDVSYVDSICDGDSALPGDSSPGRMGLVAGESAHGTAREWKDIIHAGYTYYNKSGEILFMDPDPATGTIPSITHQISLNPYLVATGMTMSNDPADFMTCYNYDILDVFNDTGAQFISTRADSGPNSSYWLENYGSDDCFGTNVHFFCAERKR